MHSQNVEHLLQLADQAMAQSEQSEAKSAANKAVAAATMSRLGSMSIAFATLDAGFLLKAQQVAQQVASMEGVPSSYLEEGST